MAIAKKVLISYIVGGVGLAGGTAGLVIGLTKKPEKIIVPEPVPTEGFSVKLHYNDKVATMPGALIKLEEAPSVPEGWIKKEDHLAAIGWCFDQELTQPVIYPYDITKEENLFLKTEIGMGKVYLHTSEKATSSTYNGTEDWYYASQYATQGNGFLKRDLPDKAHYKKLGWALTRTDFGSEASWPEPTKEGVVNDWPADGIRPDVNRIAHLYPMYEQIDFQITFDTNGGNAISPIWSEGSVVPEADQPDDPVLANNEFQGWVYADNYGEHVKGNEVDWNDIDQDMTFEAKWETVAWTANFLIYDDDVNDYVKWTSQTGVKTLTPGALNDALKLVPSRSDYTPAGWTLEKPTESGARWNKIIEENVEISDDTTVYVAYYKNNVNVTVNLNGAIYTPTTGSPSETVSFKTAEGKIASANELYEKMVNSIEGEITPPSELPNFIGWRKNGSVDLITYPFELKESEGASLVAVWANSSKFLVTFDANGGEFYYKSGDVTKTTPIISYTVDLASWQETTTLEAVYNKAIESWHCIDNPLRKEGFSFKSWNIGGIDVTGTHILSASTNLSVSWIEETSVSWWQDSFALISAKAEDTSEVSGGYQSVLQQTYYNAWHGTDADGDGQGSEKDADTFVGLQKEISIPMLDTEHTFTLRVIGEGQDILTDGTGKAYLTFEFIDCPVSSCYAPDGAARDARYNNSMIKKVSLPYLLNIMPESLTDHFKSVRKSYLTNTSSGRASDCTTMSVEETTMFILSAYEYGGDTTGSAKIENNNRGQYSDYVFAYSYYAGLGDGKNAKRHHYLTGATDTPSTLWTRTPSGGITDRSQTGFGVCYIGEPDGTYAGQITCYDPVYGYGVAPAFCVGTYPSI